jgi:hypothetical protein
MPVDFLCRGVRLSVARKQDLERAPVLHVKTFSTSFGDGLREDGSPVVVDRDPALFAQVVAFCNSGELPENPARGVWDEFCFWGAVVPSRLAMEMRSVLGEDGDAFVYDATLFVQSLVHSAFIDADGKPLGVERGTVVVPCRASRDRWAGHVDALRFARRIGLLRSIAFRHWGVQLEMEAVHAARHRHPDECGIVVADASPTTTGVIAVYTYTTDMHETVVAERAWHGSPDPADDVLRTRTPVGRLGAMLMKPVNVAAFVAAGECELATGGGTRVHATAKRRNRQIEVHVDVVDADTELFAARAYAFFVRSDQHFVELCDVVTHENADRWRAGGFQCVGFPRSLLHTGRCIDISRTLADGDSIALVFFGGDSIDARPLEPLRAHGPRHILCQRATLTLV